MAHKLLIEACPRHILFVAFQQDEETGAWMVKDILEVTKSEAIRVGPYEVAANFDWCIDMDTEYEEVRIIWRYDTDDSVHELAEPRLLTDYRRQRRMIECAIAVVICEYRGIFDFDGEITESHRTNGMGLAIPVMEGYLRNRSGDFGPYFRKCH
jgi:hypothetical protein